MPKLGLRNTSLAAVYNSGPSYDPDALIWFTTVESAGGVISSNNKNAFNNAFLALKSTPSSIAGTKLWDAIYQGYFFLGVDVQGIAFKKPILYPFKKSLYNGGRAIFGLESFGSEEIGETGIGEYFFYDRLNGLTFDSNASYTMALSTGIPNNSVSWPIGSGNTRHCYSYVSSIPGASIIYPSGNEDPDFYAGQRYGGPAMWSSSSDSGSFRFYIEDSVITEMGDFNGNFITGKVGVSRPTSLDLSNNVFTLQTTSAISPIIVGTGGWGIINSDLTTSSNCIAVGTNKYHRTASTNYSGGTVAPSSEVIFIGSSSESLGFYSTAQIAATTFGRGLSSSDFLLLDGIIETLKQSLT